MEKIEKMRVFINKIAISDKNSCWAWLGQKSETGYGRFWVNGRYRRAHRVSYEFFIGQIPHGLCVLHKCDNPSCVYPGHLFIGTQVDNIKDMDERGRRTIVYGNHHGRAILNDEAVIKIIKDSRQHKKIAVDYGVSCRTIRAVKSGFRWGRVSRDERARHAK